MNNDVATTEPQTPPVRKRRRFALFLIAAHILGVLLSIDALLSTRTSQGTIAWIVSLSTFPYVAVPAYWIFGRGKFEGYVIARREEESDLRGALGQTLPLIETTALPDERLNRFSPLEELAKMNTVGGNRVELLIDGQQTYSSIFAGIEAAANYVLVQSYIVRNDRIGNALRALLMQKAADGVEVYFLYDEIGSYRLPKSWLREMAAAGVQVRPFHSTRGSGNRLQLNFRNHRKVVVVDGLQGWVGGLNIGDEYLGLNPRFGHWRDTHMKIEGPAVLGLQLSFLEDWYWSTDRVPALNWQAYKAADSDVPVLILPSGPADRFDTASLMVQHALHSAQERIWIVSPYFVPDEGVLGALKLAALRGVEVRVLIPEKPDNPLVQYAAYAFIGPLLQAGVEVHRYQRGFLHGKVFLVDDDGVGIGTVNLDNRSFRLNFEVTALISDPGFAREVEAMLRQDFAHSRAMTVGEIENKPLWFHVISRAAFLMAPVL